MICENYYRNTAKIIYSQKSFYKNKKHFNNKRTSNVSNLDKLNTNFLKKMKTCSDIDSNNITEYLDENNIINNKNSLRITAHRENLQHQISSPRHKSYNAKPTFNSVVYSTYQTDNIKSNQNTSRKSRENFRLSNFFYNSTPSIKCNSEEKNEISVSFDNNSDYDKENNNDKISDNDSKNFYKTVKNKFVKNLLLEEISEEVERQNTIITNTESPKNEIFFSNNSKKRQINWEKNKNENNKKCEDQLQQHILLKDKLNNIISDKDIEINNLNKKVLYYKNKIKEFKIRATDLEIKLNKYEDTKVFNLNPSTNNLENRETSGSFMDEDSLLDIEFKTSSCLNLSKNETSTRKKKYINYKSEIENLKNLIEEIKLENKQLIQTNKSQTNNIKELENFKVNIHILQAKRNNTFITKNNNFVKQIENLSNDNKKLLERIDTMNKQENETTNIIDNNNNKFDYEDITALSSNNEKILDILNYKNDNTDNLKEKIEKLESYNKELIEKSNIQIKEIEKLENFKKNCQITLAKRNEKYIKNNTEIFEDLKNLKNENDKLQQNEKNLIEKKIEFANILIQKEEEMSRINTYIKNIKKKNTM